MFTNCAQFTGCISKINNTQAYNTRCLDVVMSMYKSIEYSNNYSNTLEICGNCTEMSPLVLL